MAKPYQICSRCIMDTSDPKITFNEEGVCNHCLRRDQLVRLMVHSGDAGQKELNHHVMKMKEDGVGKEYDCIIGVSGGVDSSYVAYLTKHYGLRPLAVHLDNGWNSELAVKNIQLLLDKLNIDLYTLVLDWENFKDLQLAFLKASTPDSEVPSDHAIVALMYQKAEEFDIKYVVNGCNIRTETHVPIAWSYGHMDWKYIYGVKKRFGQRGYGNFPHFSYPQLKLWRVKHNWFSILNYVDYVKKDALKILENEFNWRYYGGKHYESIYTKFYQGYIMPTKFNFDKRRSHLSALICSGEITREQAMKEIAEPPYPNSDQLSDKMYVIKKLGISEEEFDKIMKLPLRTHLDYPNNEVSLNRLHQSPIYPLMKFANRKLKII